VLDGMNEDQIFEKVNPIVDSIAHLDRAELITFFEILSARFNQERMDVHKHLGESIAFNLDKIIDCIIDRNRLHGNY